MVVKTPDDAVFDSLCRLFTRTKRFAYVRELVIETTICDCELDGEEEGDVCPLLFTPLVLFSPPAASQAASDKQTLSCT